MKWLTFVSIFILSTVCAFGEELFNGKDLGGWVLKNDKASLEGKTGVANNRFTIRDGLLIIDPKVKGDLIMQTVKEFSGDVQVKFEFKPDAKCNNDLFFRGIKFDLSKANVKNIKEGVWNPFSILVKGNEAEFTCNGESLAKRKATAAKSPLGIRAEFGAIEIKQLTIVPVQ